MKTQAERGGGRLRNPRNKNMGVQDHQKGIRGEEWRVQLTESAKGQLTESAGVVDVDNDFPWC